VTLTWKVSIGDVRGFSVYRQRSGEAAPIFVGGGYPSTNDTTFTDAVVGPATYRYFVRPVNLQGQEGQAASIDVTALPGGTIYLSIIRR
jgi:hypothetical protein